MKESITVSYYCEKCWTRFDNAKDAHACEALPSDELQGYETGDAVRILHHPLQGEAGKIGEVQREHLRLNRNSTRHEAVVQIHIQDERGGCMTIPSSSVERVDPALAVSSWSDGSLRQRGRPLTEHSHTLTALG